MTSLVTFAGEMFTDIWPDPEGDIPFNSRLLGENGMSVRGGLKAGCSYTPGFHRYPVTVTVVRGSGHFFLKESLLEYGPGSVFKIDAYMPHSFIKVVRDTVFKKDIPDLTPVD